MIYFRKYQISRKTIALEIVLKNHIMNEQYGLIFKLFITLFYHNLLLMVETLIFATWEITSKYQV